MQLEEKKFYLTKVNRILAWVVHSSLNTGFIYCKLFAVNKPKKSPCATNRRWAYDRLTIRSVNFTHYAMVKPTKSFKDLAEALIYYEKNKIPVEGVNENVEINPITF